MECDVAGQTGRVTVSELEPLRSRDPTLVHTHHGRSCSLLALTEPGARRVAHPSPKTYSDVELVSMLGLGLCTRIIDQSWVLWMADSRRSE